MGQRVFLVRQRIEPVGDRAGDLLTDASIQVACDATKFGVEQAVVDGAFSRAAIYRAPKVQRANQKYHLRHRHPRAGGVLLFKSVNFEGKSSL